MARPQGTGGEDDRKAPAPGKHSELIAFADKGARRQSTAADGFQIDGATLPGLAKARCPPADRGGVDSQRNHGFHQNNGFEPGAIFQIYRILRPLFCACASDQVRCRSTELQQDRT
jgi:hypothetical protein